MAERIVTELDRMEAALTTKIVPRYFSVVHGAGVGEEMNLAGLRTELVDCAYRMAAALRVQSSAAFAAARLFDRFMSSAGACSVLTERRLLLLPLAMVVCFDIMGKLVDSDRSSCGHKAAIPIYYYYAYHDPQTRTKATEGSFSRDFQAMEHAVLRALGSETLSPTPVEYLSECCPWFAGKNAASPAPVMTRAAEARNAERSTFICDAFVHGYISTEYSSREIAAGASFIVTEDERTISRQVPIPTGTGAVTPQLVDSLWTHVPWTRARELIKNMKWYEQTGAVCSEGLKRIYPKKPSAV